MPSDIPKLSEAILSQKTPADALNVVAAIVDELAARITALEAGGQQRDGWDTWGAYDQPLIAKDEPVEWTPDPADEVELQRLEEELHGNADADESRVLRAKIELCRDRLLPPVEMSDNTGNATETHYDTEGNAVIDLPVPTPEQIDYRAQLVPKLGLRDQYGDEIGGTAEDSFVRGGPLLLYYSDRDFVASLPHELKVAMVADVERSSPREAHEMARDLLKASTDDANDLEAVAARIFGDVESGAIHNAP
jgi:hypothetical protein